MIVGSSAVIPLQMCQLQFNHIRMHAQLVQTRGGHRAKAMAGHLFLTEPQRSQRAVNGVVGHRTMTSADVSEHKRTVRIQLERILEYRDGLRRHGHNVRISLFHALRGNSPFAPVEVKLAFLSAAKLTRPYEHVGRQLQCQDCRALSCIPVDASSNSPIRPGDVIGA